MVSSVVDVKKLRTDIQVLRAIAVLAVLAYHAGFPWMAGGYLGVDVFFVISGFLMTRLITNSIARGDFSFREFYFRRAKRLLPAALVTFLAVALLAPLFLGSSELQALRAQMAGAVTFVANVVLWRQSDYFSGDAGLKPLLHIWSLSIEEQYYFVIPLLLWFLPRRTWFGVAALLTILSLAACVYLVARLPSAAFYFLPTRAWELGLGSLAALVIVDRRARNLIATAFWPALAIMGLVLVNPLSDVHPRWDALIVCIATLLVIMREHPMFRIEEGWKPLAFVGNISYSLYLVHWPLFAFLNNVWIGHADGDQPLGLRLALIALSFLLAYLLHRYVEEPFRLLRRNSRQRTALVAGFITISALCVGFSVAVAKDADQVETDRRPNVGFAADCDARPGFAGRCSTGDAPKVMVWGDSYAMHLVPGLAAEYGSAGLVQATLSNCGPLGGIARVQPQAGMTPSWAETCIEFNARVLDYVQQSSTIEVVVLSGALHGYLSERLDALATKSQTGQLTMVDPSAEVVMASLGATAQALRSAGKHVVWIAPLPANGMDIGRCHERERLGKFSLGADSCNIPVESYLESRAPVLDLLQRIPAEAGVNVVSFDQDLCSGDACRTELDGVPLYRDEDHLSYAGSLRLAVAVGLKARINEAAR